MSGPLDLSALPAQKLLPVAGFEVTYDDGTTDTIDCTRMEGWNGLGFYVFEQPFGQPPILVNHQKVRKLVPKLKSSA